METDIVSTLFLVGQSVIAFFADSLLVATVKFFLFVYLAVLLADIVMLFILRGGVSSDLKKTLFGAERPLVSSATLIKRWEKILARLHDGNASQYKVAMLEADAFADEILAEIGHQGETMIEKLSGVHEGQLETKQELIEAHLVRNRIVHEADFALSEEETKKWLGVYRKFFDEVELFS